MMIRRVLGSMSTRQLHVISTSITNIRPASPTPSILKQYNLPVHDRISANVYVPMVLFYPSPNIIHCPQEIAEKTSRLLKYSLSETLTKYYPLAGKLRSLSHVDCNDEGVDFVETRMGCSLSDILEKAPVKGEGGFGQLFPPGSVWDNLPDKDCSPMVVQLNHFDCGGIAIAVAVSHKICDARTLCSFLNYWAALSRLCADNVKDHDESVCLHPPHFIYKLRESCDDDSAMMTGLWNTDKYPMTEEFVFHNSNIANLKAAVAKENEKLTRVEVVTALLYKCAVAAATNSNSGSFTPSMLMQLVNMRPLMVPPLPQTTVGNFLSINYIPTRIESENKLSSLAGQIREGKMKFRGMKTLDASEYFPTILEYLKSNPNVYWCSSLCNFPLHDQMDFGWGKPVKATIVDTMMSNSFVLMDTPSGDGIRAIVNLKKQDMEMFQRDKDLIALTSM